MNTKDTTAQNYLSDPARFSQVCNNEHFGGKIMIRPEDLTELDSAHAGVEQTKGVKKLRDCVKLCGGKILLVILGVENQANIHYAMPLRNFLYDALSYEKQRSDIARGHKKNRDLKGDEYLSGFSRRNRLIPVVTLVVYYGIKPWDGPRDLHDMLEIPSELDYVKEIVGNYRMNLLEICGMDNLEMYTGELKAFFGFIKYQQDQDALLEFVRQNESIFKNLSMETVHAIQVMAHVNIIGEYIKEDEKEVVDMCKAIEDMMADSRMAGETKGRAESEKRYSQLVVKLLTEKKNDLLLQTAGNPDLLHRLYQEYGI